MIRPVPLLLLILDGWGYREATDHNAIAQAETPHWDRLWQQYPHTLLSASGPDVGLPDQQMGNSEVGHMNLGSGRVITQELSRIDNAIEEGNLANNPAIHTLFSSLKASNGTLHLIGLLSSGGVHSHLNHFLAMIRLAHQQQVPALCLHAFLDGRDTPPQSAHQELAQIESLLSHLNYGEIASVVGRYYAMDRDNRWDRIAPAYQLITTGQALFSSDSAAQAVDAAYARGETDEFVQATSIQHHSSPFNHAAGDQLLFMNFRADRARQLSQALTCPEFSGFTRPDTPCYPLTTLTHYADDIPAQVIFTPQRLEQVLGELIAQQGWQQLRIAETEKYAHVTFFFNGGREQPFPGEERQLIPSPSVATYDLQPEMSAALLTEKLVAAIHSQQHALIVCNYANADMVGHTGNFDAAKKAIAVLDHCLGQIDSALQQVGGEALISADHGNAEIMRNSHTGQPHTAHTNEPIPLIYLGNRATLTTEPGVLADIAPSLLTLLGISQPAEMTGCSLLTLATEKGIHS